MEQETTTPEPIYTMQYDENYSAQLYGEYNADGETVTDAELFIQREDPRYLRTYTYSGTISECDVYARQLIIELQN
jgi:hypothetical protein|tara:strand:- start:1693 stop:1920 length:228 start_codon:yes stop_codon:yes gene_type:complete